MVGLGVVPGDCDLEWRPYAGMLAIPYWLPGGHCVNIKFRRMNEGTPKYLNTAGSHIPPYNVKAVLEATDTIVITEGEIEAITLKALGIPAMGVAGVNLWKPHFARLLDGIENIVVIGDPDEAGREFNHTVQKAVPRAMAAYLDRDINDTYVAGDFPAIFTAIEKAGGSL